MKTSIEWDPPKERVAELVGYRNWEGTVREKSKKKMGPVLVMLKANMQGLVPVYLGDVKSDIRYKIEDRKHLVVGSVGPGVGGKSKHMGVVEGGRRAGARMPPFGQNSKLMAWTVYRGFPAFVTKSIALNIMVRGLPTPNNPRTPNPPPVFVMRTWKEKQREVMRAFDGIMVDVAKEKWRLK